MLIQFIVDGKTVRKCQIRITKKTTIQEMIKKIEMFLKITNENV
jgi:hypothetical protein